MLSSKAAEVRVSPIDVVRAVDGVVADIVDTATKSGSFNPVTDGGRAPVRPIPSFSTAVSSPSDQFLMVGSFSEGYIQPSAASLGSYVAKKNIILA